MNIWIGSYIMQTVSPGDAPQVLRIYTSWSPRASEAFFMSSHIFCSHLTHRNKPCAEHGITANTQHSLRETTHLRTNENTVVIYTVMSWQSFFCETQRRFSFRTLRVNDDCHSAAEGRNYSNQMFSNLKQSAFSFNYNKSTNSISIDLHTAVNVRRPK